MASARAYLFLDFYGFLTQASVHVSGDFMDFYGFLRKLENVWIMYTIFVDYEHDFLWIMYTILMDFCGFFQLVSLNHPVPGRYSRFLRPRRYFNIGQFPSTETTLVWW